MKSIRRLLWRAVVPRGLGQRLALATALASTLILVAFGLYSLQAQSRLAKGMLERSGADIALRISHELSRAIQNRESAAMELLLTTMAQEGRLRRLQLTGVEEQFYDHPAVLQGIRAGLTPRMPCAASSQAREPRGIPVQTWLLDQGVGHSLCVRLPLSTELPGVTLMAEFDASELSSIRTAQGFDTLAFASFGALLASLLGLWIGHRSALGVREATEYAEHIESDQAVLQLTAGGSLEVQRLAQALVRAAQRLRQQRDQLIESQARNATVVNASLDAIVTVDEGGRIVDFNPAAEQAFGREREAVLGLSMDDKLFPYRIRNSHREGMLRFLTQGDHLALGKRVELMALRADGEEFPAEIAIVENHGSGQRLFTAYVRDISERVATASALATSERQHREVLESLSEVVFSLDTRLRIVYVNAAWSKLTGREASAALGCVLTEFLDVRDTELFSQSMRRAVERSEELHDRIEVRLRHRDGTLRWCLLECRVMSDAQGFISGYGGSMIDVTAQRAAQTHLQDQLKFAETLVESVPHALFVRDTGSRFRAMNRAFEQLAGIDRERTLGQTPDYILGESPEYQQVIREDRQMLLDGAPREREMSIPDAASGTIRWYRQYKTVYRNADGQPGGILGLITDITDQKESVDMLLKAATAAEAANEAKSSFLANMSHEIRTPMNAIIGMTGLALEGELTDDQRELISIVKSSADALLSLINDILDHSKIESGRFDLERQPFDLHECIELAVTMMREKAREKSLQLQTAISDDVPRWVVGDSYRLRQVLLNLLSNAIKFTHVGGVRLVLTGRSLDSTGRVQLHLRVRDTGIGIPADKLENIFEPFTQADSSTTRRFGGTGLGLSICRRLVGLMGGDMWAESAPNEGSTFHFTLMMDVASDVEARRIAPARDLLGPKTVPVHPGGSDGTPIVIVQPEFGDADRTLQELLSSWSARLQARPSVRLALEAAVDGLKSQGSMPVVLVRASTLQTEDEVALVGAASRASGSVPVIVLEDGPVSAPVRRAISRCVAWPLDASTLFDALTELTRFAESGMGELGAPVGPPTPGRGCRILLVEDNPINQKLALRLLDGMGHDVVLASDGAEALEKVSAEHFDLVFMDVQMPVMGGFEATDMIRRLELPMNRHTPIVAMTAHAMSGDRERCLNAGMDGYVSKPISRQNLLDAIEEHANRPKREDDESSPEAAVPEVTVPVAEMPAPAPIPVPEPAPLPEASQVGEAVVTAPEPEPGPVVFDHALALSQLGGDDELFTDLARMFIDVKAEDLGRLCAALGTGNPDSLANVAHAIKGSAAALGGRQAQALAAELESSCRAGRTDGLDERVRRLTDSVEALSRVLEQAIQAEEARA